MKFKTLLLAASCSLLLISLSCFAQTDSSTETELASETDQAGKFVSLEKDIDSIFNVGDLVGLSASIINGDKITWSTVRGKMNLETGVAVNPDTLFTLGSLSKTVTGTALMHLFDQGMLQLEDDINQYLPFEIHNPHFPDIPITVQMLLTHTSSLLDNQAYISSLYGCGDQTDPSFEGFLENSYAPGGSHYEAANFGNYQPGESWNYANSNFVLVAYLVERISKTSFSEYCQAHLFEPLDMKETSWFVSGVNTEELAKQYIAESEARKYPNHPRLDKNSFQGKTGVCHYSWPGYPDGNLKTSIPQFSNFLIMLMNNGAFRDRQVLKPETVNRILSPQHVKNMFSSSRWETIDQGLAWQLRSSGSEYYFSHGGSGSGISTFAFFNPTKKSGAVFFMTGDWHDKAYDRQVFDAFRTSLKDNTGE